MQLQPGERIVFAYFTDDSMAREAASVLKQSGYNEVRLDPINSPTSNISRRYFQTRLSSMTLNNSGADLAYGPLMAADPAVSGMSGYFDSAASASIILTIVCPDNSSPGAVEILQQYGATLKF
jgi:hypothetical protein